MQEYRIPFFFVEVTRLVIHTNVPYTLTTVVVTMKDKRILEAYTFKNLENVQNIRLDDYRKGL